MIKGLFVDWDVVASVGIDIVCLQVVPIDEAISFVMNVLIAIVLEALSIEIFSKGCIRKVSRLLSEILMIIFHILLTLRLYRLRRFRAFWTFRMISCRISLGMLLRRV